MPINPEISFTEANAIGQICKITMKPTIYNEDNPAIRIRQSAATSIKTIEANAEIMSRLLKIIRLKSPLEP